MKKIKFLICLLFCVLLAPSLYAQDRYLQGRLQSIGEYDEWLPEVGIGVTILEANASDTTKEDGKFRIFLPDKFKAGDQVTLEVKKPEWRILSPSEGKARIPKDLERELVTVQLLPVDSKLFWTHNRLKKFIEELSESAKKQVTPDGKPEDIDFSHAIRDWAEKYGFSPQEAMGEIEKWITQVEKNYDDLYELGLAALTKKNFDQAAKYFEDYIDHKIKQLQEIERKESELHEKKEQTRTEIILGLRAAGNTHYSNYQFDKALAQYERDMEFVSRDENPELWGKLLNNIGMANYQIGIRTKGPEILQHLGAAIVSYRKALDVYNRNEFPQQWAMTQNNLGTALNNQGIRTGGEEGAKLLAQAVVAYRNALEVRTRDQLPQDWAMTQNNLGTALNNQGTRTGGEEGAKLLAQAVVAYRNALEVRTRDQLPQDWATTQNNLGTALNNQGIRTGGEEGAKLLAQAVVAYRNALEVYTHDQLPQQWAGTQNNLGSALSQQGIRTGGEEGAKLLAQAVEAYRNALEVYIHDQLPQNWATTQNNLGNALSQQGIRTGGEEGAKLLAQAVEAYKNALEVQTYEDLPSDWARTQNNLAKAYLKLQDWQNAAPCYANVLKVYPDYEKAYNTVGWLYHEVLFQFSEAFALNQKWLERHPEDLTVRCNFAEKHFTTSRFEECEKQIAALLGSPDVKPENKIALRIIEIPDLLALDKADMVTSRLDILIETVAKQPKDFKVGWSFEGTKHFISQPEKLKLYREWLMTLFKATEGENLDAVLPALREVRANFHTEAKDDR